MLDDPDRDRRQVEHLPPGHPDLHGSGQPVTTAAATHRFVADHLIGISHLLQRRPTATWLPTGFTTRLAAQRLRGRLGQPVNGGWLRGVPRVRPELALQVRNPGILLDDPCPQRGNLRGLRTNQLHQLLIGQFRHKDIVPQCNTESREARR